MEIYTTRKNERAEVQCLSYIKEEIHEGKTPNGIIGRNERSISSGIRTFYWSFKFGELNHIDMPMKGKLKPNGRQAIH